MCIANCQLPFRSATLPDKKRHCAVLCSYYEQLGEEIVANTTGKMLLLANHNLVGEGLRLLRSFRNGIQEGFGMQYKVQCANALL